MLLTSWPSLGVKIIDDHLEDESVPMHIPTNVAVGGDTVDEYDGRRYFLWMQSEFGRDIPSIAFIQVLSFLFPPFIKTLRIMFGLSVGRNSTAFHLSFFSSIDRFISLFHVFRILLVFGIWSNHSMCCQVCMHVFTCYRISPNF